MAAKCSSDETLLEINDELDSVLEDEEKFIPEQPKIVKPKDAIVEVLEKRKSKREQLKDELTERTNDVSQELKKIKRKEWWKSFWATIASFFSPDTWVNFIQRFETLLFVVFVDTILVTMLFSLLYILYIIFNISKFDGFDVIVKIASSAAVCILCIIIHVNLPTPKKEG